MTVPLQEKNRYEVGESEAPLWAGRQSSISRSQVTEPVEYGDETEGVEETGWLGDDGQTRGRWWRKRGGGCGG